LMGSGTPITYVPDKPNPSETLCSDGADWRWRDGTYTSGTRRQGMEDRAESLAKFDAWTVEEAGTDAGYWCGADCGWDLVGVEAGRCGLNSSSSVVV